MGADQAADTLLEVAVKSLQRQGDAVDAEELAELRDNVDSRLRATNRRPLRRRPRLGRCDPRSGHDARTLIVALEVATRHAEPEPFRLGVFQV